jgi:hypothetical protein
LITPLVRVIVEQAGLSAKAMVSPGLALATAWRREPGPESLQFVTVIVDGGGGGTVVEVVVLVVTLVGVVVLVVAVVGVVVLVAAVAPASMTFRCSTVVAFATTLRLSM